MAHVKAMTGLSRILCRHASPPPTRVTSLCLIAPIIIEGCIGDVNAKLQQYVQYSIFNNDLSVSCACTLRQHSIIIL